MQAVTGNAITVVIDGQQVRTLRDILPKTPGLKVLFVAKTPAPGSVELGHYFQGVQGRLFWTQMKQYGLLRPTTEFEDDSLLDHGYGLTDIAKLPRPFGQEPSRSEYRAGTRRIIELVRAHRPKVVVFVYKKVLDNIVRFEFDIPKRANYGFNPWLEPYFGSRVFSFPLPGTPCKKGQAIVAMQELAGCACPEFSRALITS